MNPALRFRRLLHLLFPFPSPLFAVFNFILHFLRLFHRPVLSPPVFLRYPTTPFSSLTQLIPSSPESLNKPSGHRQTYDFKTCTFFVLVSCNMPSNALHSFHSNVVSYQGENSTIRYTTDTEEAREEMDMKGLNLGGKSTKCYLIQSIHQRILDKTDGHINENKLNSSWALQKRLKSHKNCIMFPWLKWAGLSSRDFVHGVRA